MGLCSKRGKPAHVPVPQPLLIGWRPDQSACATSSRFLSWEATWKNQVLNVSAQFPEIYPAASWEETQGTVCDLTDYRAQIRAHLSISGWPPRRAKGTLKLPRSPCGYELYRLITHNGREIGVTGEE